MSRLLEILAARRGSVAAARRDQAGFALIEVIVSALLVSVVASAALVGLQAASRAGAEQRHRVQAHGLAQEDQARLRVMRLSDLSGLNQTRNVVEDDNSYTINSKTQYITDSTGTASCESGGASPDYLRITSKVTWPSMGNRPPVELNSIASPPNGSVSTNRGALAISVQDAAGNGIANFPVSGTGAGSFSGSTAENGCIIFGGLPAGNYTLTPGGAAGSGYVDNDGNPPGPKTVSVVAYSTNTVVLRYGNPGTINMTFRTIVNGVQVPSKADVIRVFNNGMTSAKNFGTLGNRVSTLAATPIFPFTSPVSVYAGSCDGNNPNPTGVANPPAAAAIASVTVPPGGSVDASVLLPALDLTVWSGSSSSNRGSVVPNANVRIYDAVCTSATYTYKTNASGKLPDPGLPYGTYHVCVDNGSKLAYVQNKAVITPNTPTVQALYLNSNINGTCP
jgi:prepilin-type N-terminal cleavage/methylation domain-containing protein